MERMVPANQEIEELRQKLRMIISHASGGALHKTEDLNRSVNDICVEISRHKNDIYAQGKEIGFKAGFTHPRAVKDPDVALTAFEEWKGTWT